MKTPEKWFAVVIVCGASSALGACGGGSSDAPPAASPAASADPSASASAAPSAAPEAAPAAPEPGPPLTVLAMKLTLPKKLGTLEVKADGTVIAGGKPTWKFVGPQLVDLKGGAAMITQAADGSVKTAMGDEVYKFNDKDELIDSKGGRLLVDDGGVVRTLDPDGKPDKTSGLLKLTGFKPAARRAAVFLAVGGMMVMGMQEVKDALGKKKH